MSERATELIRTLDLHSHPEGGHYREVYRSVQRVERAGVPRTALTTIYFLLRHGEHSRWHVVASDEAWHFYDGPLDGQERLDIDDVRGAGWRDPSVLLPSIARRGADDRAVVGHGVGVAEELVGERVEPLGGPVERPADGARVRAAASAAVIQDVVRVAVLNTERQRVGGARSRTDTVGGAPTPGNPRPLVGSPSLCDSLRKQTQASAQRIVAWPPHEPPTKRRVLTRRRSLR